MSALRGVIAGVGDSITPDPTITKNRLSITLDRLVFIGVTLLAIGLVVGYQLLGRLGPRFFGDDT
jgi:hypothetical protein